MQWVGLAFGLWAVAGFVFFSERIPAGIHQAINSVFAVLLFFGGLFFVMCAYTCITYSPEVKCEECGSKKVRRIYIHRGKHLRVSVVVCKKCNNDLFWSIAWRWSIGSEVVKA